MVVRHGSGFFNFVSMYSFIYLLLVFCNYSDVYFFLLFNLCCFYARGILRGGHTSCMGFSLVFAHLQAVLVRL